MAPTKNPSRTNHRQATAAQVHLSAENEAKLRRLLCTPSSSSAAAAAPLHRQALTEGQRKQAARRLRAIYDSLANQGFSTSQIQQALAAIPVEEASLEACFHWLCLNFPAHELPLKFSSGIPAAASSGGGSVQVLAAASSDWVPTDKVESELVSPIVVEKGREEEEEKAVVAVQTKQAEWIRRYVAQQEEEEEESYSGHVEDLDWEESADFIKRVKASSDAGGSRRAAAIPCEFFAAKQAAAEAKLVRRKDEQAAASRRIRELKQEMASLGLSEQMLQVNVMDELPSNGSEVMGIVGVCNDMEAKDAVLDCENQTVVSPRISSQDSVGEAQGSGNDVVTGGVVLESESEITVGEGVADDEGMGDLFSEDVGFDNLLPQPIVNMQLKERAGFFASEARNVKPVPSNRKNGKSTVQDMRNPKVILQQQCQKNGWTAPKYDRLSEKKNAVYMYSVTVTRPPSGRGKSKTPGGPITCVLPPDKDGFTTSTEAQNAVAAWAIFTLLPELPLYRILPDSYRPLYMHWIAQGEAAAGQAAEVEELSRSKFVDAILSPEEPEPGTVNSKPFMQPCTTDVGLPENPKGQSVSQDKQRYRSCQQADNSHLLRFLQETQRSDEYKRMLEKRNALPMATVKDELLATVRRNDITVVSGATGCGKTTQVPQYILDEMIMAGLGASCNIICTQPRRIAAISVAERVAVERCEPPPGDRGSLVGYQVRLDVARNSSTRILFCTTGILLRRFGSDPDLTEVSHVVIDEVHERTILGDFLLVILKDLVEKRRKMGQPLKLIVMSATLNAALFSQYFGDCPVINVEGRTYPVKSIFLENIYEWLDYRLASDSLAAIHHSHPKKAIKNVVSSSRGRQNLVQQGLGDENLLEKAPMNPLYDKDLYRTFSPWTQQTLAKVNEDIVDYDLLEDLVISIDEQLEPGALLVFLPGQAEIQLLLDRLRVSKRFGGSSAEWLLPLHSSVASSDQRKVFMSPEEGVRKIILATNIAEASVTIDDVVHVIDCGKHKEKRFDSRRGMASLVGTWISQANAKQRSGRAGRVKPGNCFRLYTEHRYENKMHPFQIPEILRAPLVELCLQIKVLSFGDVSSFLQKALQQPPADAVQNALSTLHKVGALDESEALTSLGYHLAALPVDVHIGKMLVYGAIFGCLSPILTVAACLSHKSPFVIPHDQKDAAARAKRSLLGEKVEDAAAVRFQQSDHLAMVAAYNSWSRIVEQKGGKAGRNFCSANFLSVATLVMLRDMRAQLASLVQDIGFISKAKTSDGKKAEYWMDDLSQPFNANSAHVQVVKASICAGLYPNVAAMDEESIQGGHAGALSLRAGLSTSQKPRWSDGNREVFIHPSSINHTISEFHHPFLVFHEKVSTSRVYLRDTTVVSPYALLLFGGSISVQHQAGRLSVDGWLQMRAPAQTAVYFKELRLALDSLLRAKTGLPKGSSSAMADGIISTITQLLIDEDKTQV